MKQSSSSGKIRKILTDAEKERLLVSVLARVAAIRERLRQMRQDDLLPWLDKILRWDFARLQAERDTFQSIYKPISILPPDQYLSVVLQATEGCSWNRCTFCTFYHDRRFHIKSPAQLREQARQVKTFLGDAIGLRKSIFLADANALIIPQPRLLELLRVIREEFPIGAPHPGTDYALQGVYSFLDIFGAERKTLENYRELAALGLQRVYIGLETGDEELFALLNKPGSPLECVQAVQTIKAAGISVGVIILAGAGGDQFAQQHLEHSLQAIFDMQLDRRDIVYLSPLVLSGDDAYSQHMRGLGIRELNSDEMLAQVNTVKTALKALGENRPRVTLYHIEEFLY